jgi:hypothetical protein
VTVLEAVKAKALAEFDQMVAAQEKSIRAGLSAQGCSRAEINETIASCQPGLAAQREEIGRMVAIQLMKHGVPLEADANVWN